MWMLMQKYIYKFLYKNTILSFENTRWKNPSLTKDQIWINIFVKSSTLYGNKKIQFYHINFIGLMLLLKVQNNIQQIITLKEFKSMYWM